MTVRNTGFWLAIIGVGVIAVLHAAYEITISTRFERWQAERAYGTGLYPRDWRFR